LLRIKALLGGAATERLLEELPGVILPSRRHLSLGTALEAAILTKDVQKVIAPVV
jgi:hypothetical protein